MSSINLELGAQYLGNAVGGPDTIIVLNGTAILIANGQSTALARGSIIFARFATQYVLHASGNRTMLFKASVPSTRSSMVTLAQN